MTPLLISLAAFVGVAALVGGVALVFRGESGGKVEDRLDLLAGVKTHPSKAKRLLKDGLAAQANAMPTIFDLFMKRLGNLSKVFEQADTNLTAAKFFAISGGMCVAGAAAAGMARMPIYVIPVAGLMLGVLPMCWLTLRRRRRLRKFAAQLPGALELVSRALRAGHSLASGMSLVAEEMQPPIKQEFQRVFEAQNLGISLEDALRSMCLRMPNLDLKFFVTAVVLQRQTGGDLAEILDKIGHLIRERFKIWGQVQALTGEGRLSGIVLLALPPVLFLAVWWLNPDYSMMLFTDPMGNKMLAGAVVLQVLGALVIKKIINIKV